MPDDIQICPDCGGELASWVRPAGDHARYAACSQCGYPLEYRNLRARLKNENITEAARFYILSSGSDPEILSAAEGLAFVEANQDISWPFFEDEGAVGFRVENFIIIFNFGRPGSFARYFQEERTS